jgi:hypothetical protein
MNSLEKVGGIAALIIHLFQWVKVCPRGRSGVLE